MGGETGVALALVVVSVRARWHTVAPGAASPARSVTQPRPTRKPAPCYTRTATIYDEKIHTSLTFLVN